MQTYLGDVGLALDHRHGLLDELRVDGDALGAVVRLVDADQPVRQLEHVGPQRDDDELGVPGPLLDVVGDDGHVLEVERGVNLVHDVEGGRFVVMKGEDQGKTGERLLSSGKIGDVLPRLLGWSDTEHDSLGEGIQAVHKLQLCVSTQCDHLVHLLQLSRDNGESR